MNRNSLKVQFVLVICGITFCLLTLGNILIISSQKSILNSVINIFQNQIDQMISERNDAEKKILNKNVKWNADIFCKSIATYVYDYAIEDVNKALQSFISYPEMHAIKINENDNSLIASVYKESDNIFSDDLSSTFNDSDYIVYNNKMSFDKNTDLGTISFYYSYNEIDKKMDEIKKIALNKTKKTIDEIHKSTNKKMYYQLAGSIFILLLLIVLITISMNILIIKPINHITHIAENLSNLDISFNVNSNRKDEIGFLFYAIDKIIQSFRKIIFEMQLKCNHLSQTSINLVEIASSLSKNSKEINHETEKVTSSAIDMNSDISMIASSAEQMKNNTYEVQSTIENMSNNIDVVANSVEDMSVSMNQIRNNAQQGKDVTINAVKKAESAEILINSLTKVAMEIGDVIKMIKQLGHKIDTLAINAGIEAASHKSSGKGFEVISKEIKRFATQSKKSAEKIAVRIKTVKEIADDVVIFVNNITDIIQNISVSVDQIFNSIDQQSFAAQQIASNAVEANTFTQVMKQNMSDLSINSKDVERRASNIVNCSDEVTNNIQRISSNISDNYSITKDIKVSAQEINNFIYEFKEIVSKFKISEPKEVL